MSLPPFLPIYPHTPATGRAGLGVHTPELEDGFAEDLMLVGGFGGGVGPFFVASGGGMGAGGGGEFGDAGGETVGFSGRVRGGRGRGPRICEGVLVVGE